MALVNCPECKRSVSDSAVACPHCGYPSPGAADKQETSASTATTKVESNQEDHAEATPSGSKPRAQTMGGDLPGLLEVGVL